ncbi:MAG: hypothetical protein PHO13_07110 [Fermentimonas sp.]|nr:hypothetical protein [Fermentimonas sp.]MDD3189251.1 hypothetical protein [Fermentimonas sp.]MDD3511759.1 hypothetical protein [Fermentimonas sp.]MDD4285139.1 hypothetical protein [Fermentimonas sp.]NLC85487.1 hypothetical protein [Bacteroidales bacterium]
MENLCRLCQVLIKQARLLYADDPKFRLDLDNMVYALGSTTIDLCLSLFTKEQAFFVNRSKDNINFVTLVKHNVDSSTGVLDDVAIRLTEYYSVRKYPVKLRLVTYEDFSNGKVYHF